MHRIFIDMMYDEHRPDNIYFDDFCNDPTLDGSRRATMKYPAIGNFENILLAQEFDLIKFEKLIVDDPFEFF